MGSIENLIDRIDFSDPDLYIALLKGLIVVLPFLLA